MQVDLLILENDFLIVENQFLILENEFLITNCISNIKIQFLILGKNL